MNKPEEVSSALSRWTTSSQAWVFGVVAAGFFSLVGGVVVLGATVLLIHVLLWARIATGSRLLKNTPSPAQGRDEARSVLTVLIIFQVLGLLFLAALLLGLSAIDLNTH